MISGHVKFSSLLSAIVSIYFALCHTAPIAEHFNRIELSVLAPLNASYYGESFEIRLQVDFYTADNLRVNPPNVVLDLDIFEEGIKKDSAKQFSPWRAIRHSGMEGHGIQILTFVMNAWQSHDDYNDSSPSTIVCSAATGLFLYKLPVEYTPTIVSESSTGNQLSSAQHEDNHFLYLLLNSIAPRYNQLVTTVSIAFDDFSVDYKAIMKLSPLTVDIFDWSGASATPASLCSAAANKKKQGSTSMLAATNTNWHHLCIGNHSHNLGSTGSGGYDDTLIQFSAHYDVSVVMFSDTTWKTPAVTTTGGGPDRQDVIDSKRRFLEQLKTRTGGHLVVIASHKTFQLLTIAASASADLGHGSRPLLKDVFQQMSYGEEGSRVLVFYKLPVRELLETKVDLSQWATTDDNAVDVVVEVGADEVTQAVQHMSLAREEAASPDNIDTDTEVHHTARNRMASSLSSAGSMLASSVHYTESSTNGLNYLTIHNGCIDEQNKIILLNTAATTDSKGRHRSAILSGAMLRQLSGHGFIPLMPLSEITVTEANVKNIQFFNTSAAMVKPYYGFNIFHHFQSLAGLLHYHQAFSTKSTNNNNSNNNHNNNNKEAVSNRSLPSPAEELRYLLLPHFDPYTDNEYEWSNTMLSLVTRYLDLCTDRPVGAHSDKHKTSAGDADDIQERMRARGGKGERKQQKLSVLFKRQIHSLFREGRNHKNQEVDENEMAAKPLLCFRDLVLIGQADTDKGFFADKNPLGQFRDMAYKMFGDNNDADGKQWNYGGGGGGGGGGGDGNGTRESGVGINSGNDEASSQASSNDSSAGAGHIDSGIGSDSVSNDGDGFNDAVFQTDVTTQLHYLSQFTSTQQQQPRKIKVAFSLRQHTRRITNLPSLHRALIDSGVVDMEWMGNMSYGAGERPTTGHGGRRPNGLGNVWSSWVVLENLSLREQVLIMRDTDLFIGVHGSAFINAALFMKPHSVCIALMQSRHIEFILTQMLHQADIPLHFLPVLDQNKTSNCYAYALECETRSLSRAGGMDCLGIRNCDVEVDVTWFQALVELAAHHIRANKFRES